jgi:hypothetical protein
MWRYLSEIHHVEIPVRRTDTTANTPCGDTCQKDRHYSKCTMWRYLSEIHHVEILSEGQTLQQIHDVEIPVRNTPC